MKVGVIGGGAAGFFAAINTKIHHPKSDVIIIEKSQKLLSKVKVSGGGRCNVTNGERAISKLAKAYPRGEKALKKIFGEFNTKHSFEWFESRGVELTTQEDNCVFPVSQNSQTIINCFMDEVERLGIEIKMGKGVVSISEIEFNRLKVVLSNDESLEFDKIIVATGGSPRKKGLLWLESLGHQIEEPVPSLFTFNMPQESIRSLMGVVVEETLTSIQGTKLKSDGPLLITHWGMSGPSILKLSAYGARILNEKDYKFNIQVNWVNEANNNLVQETLLELTQTYAKKYLGNIRPYYIPERLWLYLLEKIDLPTDKRWGELGKKGINKLMNILTNDIYQVQGKTTFKEEFVTCGGISLDSINIKTMESRVVKNLYFAGEVIDVDGITGGYNFQAAWTTGFIASQLK